MNVGGKNTEKISEIVNKLRMNPLFRMSQSSMELTHSNVWAWLFDILEDKQIFFNLFNSKMKYTDQKCHRELHHMDVIIASNKSPDKKSGKSKGNPVVKVDWDSPALIIENKTKDLAKTQQLEKYRETINLKSKVSVKKVSVKNDFKLATLFKAPKIKNWKEITYAQLAVNLKKIFKTNNEKSFNENKAFISEYIIMLDNLVSLSSLLMQKESKKYDFLSYDSNTAKLIENLNYIGLTPSYMKYKYGIMGYEFNKYLIKINFSPLFGTSGVEGESYCFKDKPGVQLDWGISGTSKEGWLDVALIINKETRIGVQIQNGMYRRFICNLKGNAEELAIELKKKGQFFKKDYEFKKFGDTFRYQNLQAIDAPGIINDTGKIIPGKTYKEIFDYVKKDLRKLCKRDKNCKSVEFLKH